MRKENLIDDTDIERIEKTVGAEVNDAVAFADAGSLEPLSELTRFVYSDRRSA
jgi:pyruvate dehydrogenase E1 component alpha subunit/2-oxoisovalerate dehydrogenase E1 component